MSDFSTLSPLSDAELDAVTGGYGSSISVLQNARGGDSIACAGNGGNATTTGGTATGGAGGVATSGIGGAGGANLIGPSGGSRR